MPQRQFKFLATAEWVTDKVQKDLKEKTAVSLVEVKRQQGNSGTLTLHASTREELDAAVEYLGRDPLFKVHFRPA